MPSVVGLLTRDFLRWVAVAFVVATPLSYWGAWRWLQDFAYRVEVGPRLLLGADGLVGAVAGLTVALQAWRAARLNPATTLRDE